MPSIGLFLPPEAVARLSPAALAELRALSPFAEATPTSPPPPQPPAEAGGGQEEPRWELIRFDQAQAHAFLDHLDDERSGALAAWIADQPEPNYSYPEAVAAIGPDSTGGIRGAVAALTYVARIVTGNRGNERMHFRLHHGTPGRDRARIHPDTWAALRAALAERRRRS